MERMERSGMINPIKRKNWPTPMKKFHSPDPL
jgi:hypothetical protein